MARRKAPRIRGEDLPELCSASPEVAPPSPPPGAAPAAPAPALEVCLAVREVLGMPPGWLAQLPLGTVLRLKTREGTPWAVSTAREAYAALRAAREPVFTGSELGALALAAENGRASAADLARWLAEHVDSPAQRLDPATALAGLAAPETPSQRWHLDRVLRAYGAELTRVGVAPDNPAPVQTTTAAQVEWLE